MAKVRYKPAEGAIDITKLRAYVDGHAALLKKRADLNGEIRTLLNNADDAGFDKKAVEAVSKRKTKNREAEIARELKVREYEVALGLATQDMFEDGPGEPDAAETAQAEARGDPVPAASPEVAPAPAKKQSVKKGGAPKKSAKKALVQRPSEAFEKTGNGDSTQETADFPYESGRRAAKAGWGDDRNPFTNDKESQAKWARGHAEEMKLIDAAPAERVMTEAEEAEHAPRT